MTYPSTKTTEVLEDLTVKGHEMHARLWFVGLRPEQMPRQFHRTKSHWFHYAPCDVCWESMWLPRESLLWRKGAACKITPGCPGRHLREGVSLSAVRPAETLRCATCRERDAVAIATHKTTGDEWAACGRCRDQAGRYRSPIEFTDLREEAA